jgi:hypothetical protein
MANSRFKIQDPNSVLSVLLLLRFFAARDEMQILRCAQDDMSF